MPAYSVQNEAQKILFEGILDNDLHQGLLPAELQSLARGVTFTGNPNPSVPINWRFTESVAALKAFEACMISSLIQRKYKEKPETVTINTDHASLFFMSALVTQIIGQDGKPIPYNPAAASSQLLFPDRDIYGMNSSLYRGLATSIYRTKDGKFYHCHGSLNPDHTLTALGLPRDSAITDVHDVVARIANRVSQLEATALDKMMNDEHGQAGVIALSAEEYFASPSGKANSDKGLYNITAIPNHAQLAAWWPENTTVPSSPKRPLAGLKVVDLTRIIAGPSITRSLAELGASIMRVTSPDGPDLSGAHQDLNWGKWNCELNLKSEEGKERLRDLIREADVVVDGYRPGALERLGFGREAVLDMVKDRTYGILHVRENCYGWEGPFSGRSGWQQISDACCGVSLEYGRAMGNDEPVTPVFPNSDYCTGICGSAAVLQALMERAEKGGSYGVDVALNYYSQWLVRSVGTYPSEVWKPLWSRHGSPVFRHYQNMPQLMPAMLKLLYTHDQCLFEPAFFERRRSAVLKTDFIVVKPIAQFRNGQTWLGYNVGTRGNGTDDPVWPVDLMTEVVTY